MKIKTKVEILNYESQKIIETENASPLTFFTVFVTSLNSVFNNEIMPAEMKGKIYQITKKLYASNEPDFTPDQIAVLKERVGKCFSPMVYGRVCDLFDGVEQPKEAELPPVEPKAPEKPPSN